jgi:hypothetical protein
MASDSSDQDVKQLKKQLKSEKKSQKKTKKKAKKVNKKSKKSGKKAAKKQKKLQKMAKKLGRELPPAQRQGQAQQQGDAAIVDGQAEFKSVQPRVAVVYTPEISRRVDRMFEMSGSEIKKRWEEKYDEDFSIPDHVKKVYHENLPPGALDTEPAEVVEEEAVPSGRFGKLKAMGKKGAKPAQASSGGEAYPWYHFKCMLLSQKMVKEGINIIVKLILLVIDLFIWVLLFIPRLIINILLFIVRLLKRLTGGRKKKSEATET